MRSTFSFIALCFLVGCNQERQPALLDYACTVEQMRAVEAQTTYCKDNTGYMSSHCYLTAMDRNCPKKGNTK